MHVNMDKFSQVLRGSANDQSDAETRCLIFSVLWGASVEKRFGVHQPSLYWQERFNDKISSSCIRLNMVLDG